jgi:hypothetical protein
MEKLRLKKTNGFVKKNSIPILYTLKTGGHTYEVSTRNGCSNRVDEIVFFWNILISNN